jgi:glycosyltransferase involved in cell wall biosynthesis
VVKAGIVGLPPVVLSLHGQYISIVKATFLTIAGRPTPTTISRAALDLPGIVRTHFRQGNWRRFRGCDATVPSMVERNAARLAFMLEKDRVNVVPNGIDTDLFHPGETAEARAVAGLPPNVPLALFAGRLDRGKGAQFAIDAIARLRSVPDAHLALAGDGSKRTEFAKNASRLGIADRVLFLGRVSPEEVAMLMRASDVVVYPSLLGESFGLVVAQAMASGRPVVASRRGAIPDVLGRDGTAGILVTAGRSGPLAAALGRLFANSDLRAAMGRQGRAVALRTMTIDRMVDATYAVYQAAVRRHGAV